MSWKNGKTRRMKVYNKTYYIWPLILNILHLINLYENKESLRETYLVVISGMLIDY